MPDPKPVGTLTPIEPKPVGALKPLNQAANTDQAYLNALNHTTKEDKRIASVWGTPPKEETGLMTDLYHSLARGSDRLGAMLAKTPGMVYDLAAVATDALVNNASKGINAVAGTDLKTDYQTTTQTLANDLGISGENKIAKYYDERVKASQEKAAEKYDKGITDYFGAGEYKKAFGLIANSVAESAPVTISLLMGNAAGVGATGSILGGGTAFAAEKKSELDEKAPNLDHNTKMSIALSNGLFEGIFEQFGITKLGGITKNILLKDGKEAAKKIAEEGFKDVYTPVAKKYLGTSAEESISEAATQFAQNAVDKYSGYKPEMDLREGVADAAIVGLAAGAGFSAGPSALDAASRSRANREGKEIQENKAEQEKKQQQVQVKKDAEKSRFALETAQQGEEAVRAFKENVYKQIENKTLTPEEGSAAISRVNAFKEYNDIVGALDLPEEKKLEVFDKTYQKQNLEAELRDMGDPGKLHPLKQAEYQIKEKFANDLQKDINEALLNAQIKNETTVATKTIEDLAKKEQKEAEKDKPKVGEKPVKKSSVLQTIEDKFKNTNLNLPDQDTRKYEDLTVGEYNNSKLNARFKHKVTAEWLHKLPGRKSEGVVAERVFDEKTGNSVLGVKVPGGKIIRFASSMKRIYPDEDITGGFTGRFMEERFDKDFIAGTPIGMKVYEISPTEEGGKTVRVIKGYRKDNGKFIGWVKETQRGTSSYTPEQVDEIEHLQTVPEIDDEISTDQGTEIPVPILQTEQKTSTLASNEKTANREKPTSRNNSKISQDGGKNIANEKATVRKGEKGRQVKDPQLQMALRVEPTTPTDVVMQHFIKGAQVNISEIKRLFKVKNRINHTEVGKRAPYRRIDGQTVKEIASDLHKAHPQTNLATWEDTVESVIRKYDSPLAMAQDFNLRNNKVDPSEFSPAEQEMTGALKEIDNDRILVDTENIIDKLEEKSPEELIRLSNLSQEELNKWEGDQNIINDDGTGPLFQKESTLSNDRIERAVEVIKRAFPKVDVVYNEEMKSAGRLEGNTIYINPYSAGFDTPIHEGAHIYLDAMDENTLYRDAVDQLRNTPLWDQVKEKYDTLTQRELANEVLAEAIGREGAKIFNDVTQESKFKKLLKDIFAWLKEKLGLEKNYAKQLARKIITGQGTAELTGKTRTLAPKKVSKKDFNFFREKELGRDLDREEEMLEAINTMLEEEVSPEERSELIQAHNMIMDERKSDQADYKEYKKEMDTLKEIEQADTLENFSLDQLIEAYNTAKFHSASIDRQELDAIKTKLALMLSEQGRVRLRKNAKFSESKANTKDLDWLDVWTKVHSHMNQNFPEIQELSKLFDQQHLKMAQERMENKKKLQKLADAVIKEKNKKLGIRETIKGLVFSDNAKYFEFMDDGTGHFVSGEGLSTAQKDFLDYIKELTKDRKLTDEDGYILDNEVIKIDQDFNEKYKGWFDKIIGFLKIPIDAYQEAKNNDKSPYGNIYNGRLTNKFNKARPKNQGYSKDFYKAAQQYIDDYTHVKYMNKVVPLVDAISTLNERGYGDQFDKPNVVKWLHEWSQEQLYKAPKSTSPGIDLTLKALRRLTSTIVMGFNIPAAGMNLFIGNYNNWRKDAHGLGLKSGLIANKRFFSKKGQAILREYGVVDSDFDSNPKAYAGRLFDMLAYGAQRYGEMQIQGSMFLSQMPSTQWNSFEYKNGELKLKEGADQKQIDEAFVNYKNKVSDVQGKYAEKDRRNFMRGEFGKAVSQFRTWMPDYMKERFGEEYIDRDGVEHKGSFNGFFKQALKDIRADWSNKKLSLKLPKNIANNKQIAQNLKGALFIASLLIYKYSDDDDDKVKKKVLSAENAVSNLMFVFDPESLHFTADNPLSIQGTVLTFLDVLKDLKSLDDKNLKKDLLKITPYRKVIKPLVTGNIEDAPERILLGD